MQLKHNRCILVLRIKDFFSYDFIEEHTKILKKNGKVWMLKIGKKIPEKSLEHVLSEGGYLILREQKQKGGNYFLCHMIKFKNTEISESSLFPVYYSEIKKYEYEISLDGTWICVDSIEPLNLEVVSQLKLVKNQKLLTHVIDSTRTSMMYATLPDSLSREE